MSLLSSDSVSTQTKIEWSLHDPASYGEITIHEDRLTRIALYSAIPKKYKLFRVCDGVCYKDGTITLEIESGIPGYHYNIAGRLSVPPSLFATEIIDFRLYYLKDGKFHEITEAQSRRLSDVVTKISDAERAMRDAKENFEQAKQSANYAVESFDE